MQHLRMTRHACQRLQQRGSRPKDVAIVMTYGDIEVPAPGGLRPQDHSLDTLPGRSLNPRDLNRAI